MAIDERSRHQLYQRLEQVLGKDETTVLMEHLPPVGWADVTTKRDLDVLEMVLTAKLTAEISGVRGEMAELRGDLRGEIAELREEFASQFRTFLFAMAGLNLASISMVFAVTKL